MRWPTRVVCLHCVPLTTHLRVGHSTNPELMTRIPSPQGCSLVCLAGGSGASLLLIDVGVHCGAAVFLILCLIKHGILEESLKIFQQNKQINRGHYSVYCTLNSEVAFLFSLLSKSPLISDVLLVCFLILCRVLDLEKTFS